MKKLDESDPFVQKTFKAVVGALVTAFVFGTVVWLYFPVLRPLLVAVGGAAFLGFLALFCGTDTGHFAAGTVAFVFLLVSFPAAGYAAVILLRVPRLSFAAEMLSLLPFGIIAPTVFKAIERSYRRTKLSRRQG